MNSFIDLLKERVVIFDGAMGTSIQKKIKLSEFSCNELLNIESPNIIKEIHADFIKPVYRSNQPSEFFSLFELEIIEKLLGESIRGIATHQELSPIYASGGYDPSNFVAVQLPNNFREEDCKSAAEIIDFMRNQLGGFIL
jgi:hypothetical protein